MVAGSCTFEDAPDFRPSNLKGERPAVVAWGSRGDSRVRYAQLSQEEQDQKELRSHHTKRRRQKGGQTVRRMAFDLPRRMMLEDLVPDLT